MRDPYKSSRKRMRAAIALNPPATALPHLVAKYAAKSLKVATRQADWKLVGVKAVGPVLNAKTPMRRACGNQQPKRSVADNINDYSCYEYVNVPVPPGEGGRFVTFVELPEPPSEESSDEA